MASYSYSLAAWKRIYTEVTGGDPTDALLREVQVGNYDNIPLSVNAFMEKYVSECAEHPRRLVREIKPLGVIVYGDGGGPDCRCWFCTPLEYVEFCRKRAESPDASEFARRDYECAKIMTDEATLRQLRLIEKMGADAPSSFDVVTTDGTFATITIGPGERQVAETEDSSPEE